MGSKINRQIYVGEDFYKIISPILQINRTVGFFPLKIYKREKSYSLVWCFNRVAYGYIVNFMLFTLAITGLLLGYQIDEVYNIRLSKVSGKFSTLIEISLLSVTWLVYVISTPFLFKHFFRYIENIKRIDASIGSPSVKSQRNKYILLITLTMITTCMCLGLDLYVWEKICRKYLSVLIFIRNFVPFYFSYVVTMIVELNFIIFVYILKSRLSKFNELLCTYIKEESYKNSGDKNKLQNIQILKFLSIRDFQQTYERISAANRALNNFCGFHIMIVLLGCLIHLLVTPYCLYLQVNNTGDYVFIFSQSFWMLCHILRLLLIVEPCHSSKLEGKKTINIVGKLLYMDLAEKFQYQLHGFLNQLFHNPIEFSAFGMVNIDRELIVKIVGSVSTYLVILFQFKNM